MALIGDAVRSFVPGWNFQKRDRATVRKTDADDGVFELSKTERLREIWKKTAKVRLAVGAILLVWGAVAASSWAVAATCAIAATRAGIAWTWAFLAVDGLLRACGMENNVLAVSVAVWACVAAVLAIPAAEAAETLVSQLPIPEEPLRLVENAVPSPGLIPKTNPPLTVETVREIFADIRSDHPGQNFVTLEQSVRRIEGLARGVPLSDSARLADAVPDAHSVTANPSGKIVSAMKKLDLFSGDSPNAFDHAARKLSEKDIENVLREAYSNSPEPENISNVPALSDVPVSSVVSSDSVFSLDRALPIEGEAFSESAWNLSDADSSREPSSAFPAWITAALLAVPFGIAVYFWSKRFRRGKNDTPSIRENVLPETRLPIVQTEPHNPASLPEVAVPIAVPEKSENSVSRPAPAYPALVLAVSDVLAGEYGFSSDFAVSEAGDSPEVEARRFSLPTPGGVFLAETIETRERPTLRFAWRESWEIRFSSSKELPACGEPHEIRSAVRNALEDAYFEVAEYREKIKNEELRNVRAYEISDTDFSEIYRQLERPETVSGNRETGGFWFWSGYSIQNGVFRFENLANPSEEEIDATSADFAIRSESWEKYAGSNISRAFLKAFPPWERKLFSKALERASKDGWNPNPFPLAVDFFNWHKHPGAPLCPSGGDINHPDSAPGKFEDSPSLWAVTFIIANRLDGSVWTRAEGLWNSCVLRWSECGGKNDYLLTAWKLLRISSEERERRERFIEGVWIAKASSLGICDGRWKLLHLSREAVCGGWKFVPDLRPVAIRKCRSERVIFDKSPKRE